MDLMNTFVSRSDKNFRQKMKDLLLENGLTDSKFQWTCSERGNLDFELYTPSLFI